MPRPRPLIMIDYCWKRLCAIRKDFCMVALIRLTLMLCSFLVPHKFPFLQKEVLCNTYLSWYLLYLISDVQVSSINLHVPGRPSPGITCCNQMLVWDVCYRGVEGPQPTELPSSSLLHFIDYVPCHLQFLTLPPLMKCQFRFPDLSPPHQCCEQV